MKVADLQEQNSGLGEEKRAELEEQLKASGMTEVPRRLGGGAAGRPDRRLQGLDELPAGELKPGDSRDPAALVSLRPTWVGREVTGDT
jgi:hypothetical protein